MSTASLHTLFLVHFTAGVTVSHRKIELEHVGFVIYRDKFGWQPREGYEVMRKDRIPIKAALGVFVLRTINDVVEVQPVYDRDSFKL